MTKVVSGEMAKETSPSDTLAALCAASFWATPSLTPHCWERACSSTLSFSPWSSDQPHGPHRALLRNTESQTPSQVQTTRIFALMRFSSGSYAHKILRRTAFANKYLRRFITASNSDNSAVRYSVSSQHSSEVIVLAGGGFYIGFYRTKGSFKDKGKISFELYLKPFLTRYRGKINKAPSKCFEDWLLITFRCAVRLTLLRFKIKVLPPTPMWLGSIHRVQRDPNASLLSALQLKSSLEMKDTWGEINLQPSFRTLGRTVASTPTATTLPKSGRVSIKSLFHSRTFKVELWLVLRIERCKYILFF